MPFSEGFRWSTNHRTDLGPRTLSPWARLLAYVAIATIAPLCEAQVRTSDQMNSKMPDQLHLTLGTLVHLLGLRHWTRTLDLGPWRHLLGLGHWPLSLDLGHSWHLPGLEHWPWTLDLGPSWHLLGLGQPDP